MNLVKRLKNLWALSAFEPTEPYRGSLSYLATPKEAGPTEMPFVKVPTASFGPMNKRPMAQIIKRKKVDPIDDILGNESDNPIF